jgi:hypothetical protein
MTKTATARTVTALAAPPRTATALTTQARIATRQITPPATQILTATKKTINIPKMQATVAIRVIAIINECGVHFRLKTMNY